MGPNQITKKNLYLALSGILFLYIISMNLTFRCKYLGIKTILQFVTSEICQFSSGKQKNSFTRASLS